MNYKYQYPGQPQPSGMSPLVKTLLYVGVSLVSAGVVLATIVGIIVMVVFGKAVDSVTDIASRRAANDQQANSSNSNPGMNGNGSGAASSASRTPPLTVESITPPASVDAAVEMLRRQEWQYHQVAAKWLEKQQVNSSQADRVSAVLISAYSRTSPADDSLLSAIEKWAHRSIASDLAARLTNSGSSNGRILAILTRLNEPAAGAGVAKLLASRADAAQARQVLVSLGPEVAPFVAPFVLNDDVATQNHAREILEGFGIDPQEILLEALVSQLEGAKFNEVADALDRIARLEPDDSIRDRVNESLFRIARDSTLRVHARDSLGKALDAWWIPEMIESVNDLIEAGQAEAKILDLAAKNFNEDTIAVLCKRLKEERSDRQKYTDCLIKIGQPAAQSVAAIPSGGRFDSGLDDEVKRFLRAVDASPTSLLDREIAKLTAVGSRIDAEAFDYFRGKTPESLELEESEHERVAKAMSDAVIRMMPFVDEPVRQIYREWVTANSAAGLAKLVSDAHSFNEEDLKKLIALKVPEVAGPAIGERLSSRFKAEETVASLLRSGSDAQYVCLYLLKTVSDPQTAVVLTNIVGQVGTEEAIAPLQELVEVTERRNITIVAKAAREAMREIRRRALAAGGGDDSDN